MANNLQKKPFLDYQAQIKYLKQKQLVINDEVSAITALVLIMTIKNKPQAVMMSFQREYAEPYEWLVEVFRDWAFIFFLQLSLLSGL